MLTYLITFMGLNIFMEIRSEDNLLSHAFL